MSDIQFGTESYQAMDSWSAGSESQTAANTSFLNGAPCSNGDCENTENPAEEAWVKLVSAIPVADQVQNLKCVAQGTAAPSDDEVQSLVSQIRPDSPNNYALRPISILWKEFQQQFSLNPETAVAPILRSKLADLSNGWQGNDFDAFAEQMEVVFANCEQIASDIGDGTTGMSGLLEQKASEIFSLQGAASGELPYPAPQYWVEDKGGLFSNPKVHVRAPFKPGDCEVAEGCMLGDGDAEQAMELGGFDSEYTGELNQYMTDQTEYHYTRLKAEQLQANEAALPTDAKASEKAEDVKLTPEQESALRAEAERLATEDANTRAAEDYEAADQDYQARATEQNETVVARWNDAESSASSFAPTVETSRDTTFRESASDLDSAAYSPPSGGNFNTDLSSSGTSGLNSPSTTSTFGPGGNLTGGSNTGTDTGLNPWESGSDDDDDTSGGLASGGLSGGTGTLTPSGLGTGGGGMGTGGGGGLGPGSGLFGPAAGGAGSMTGMTGAGGAGRGAGAGGMGKGQGLFGKTAGAGVGAKAGAGGMMGGRGAGGLGDDEEADTGTWLTEDEDVWGLARFNDDNDPLA